MSTYAFELLDGGTLEGLSVESAIGRWKAQEGEFWIDAGAPDRATLEPLLDELGVGEFVKTRCFRVGRSTVVLALPHLTFATLPIFADSARTRRTYAAAVCLRGLLLTFRAHPLEEAERAQSRMADLEIDNATTSHLLSALLIRRGAATSSVARELRDTLTSLAERMDVSVTSVEPLELERLQRRLNLLNAITEEQRQAFELLAHAKSPGFDPSLVSAQVGLLTTMAAATERLVDRNEGRIDDLIRRVQDHKTELLNRRLGVLTIISAIFMPLTLLAGIWGMNFENMPELSYPNAYPIALSLMAGLALGGAWIFYRRGWFD